jgi:hypothetical protein
MSTKKLIELYGRRFTSSSKLVGFIVILIFGLLLAFHGKSGDLPNATKMNAEYSLEDQSQISLAAELKVKRVV